MRPIIALLMLGLLASASACSGGDKDAFRNVDHDKNGKISYEELLFVFPEVTPETFARIDTDGDGTLSESEYAAFLKGDAARAATEGHGPAQTATEPKSQAPTQTKPGTGNQLAVPFKGEEVIEIPAPGNEPNARGKSGKGRKEQKESKSKTDDSPKGEATQYTVGHGDNLSRIARKFGLTVEDITRANGNMAPDTLRDGQVLNIPAHP